jgi:hypothetical protein
MAGLFLRHNGMSQSESEGIGPLRVFPHVGFAVVGLVFWVIYAITDNDTTGWVAVAGIGGAFLIAGTFLITRDQHRRRELARVEAGPGAAAGVRADAAAGRRVPAESYIPIWLASGHGLLGAATLLLVFLERAGVSAGGS